MREDRKVRTSVLINKGCGMQYAVNGDDDVEFLFDGQLDGFELVFTAESLARFFTLATKALAEAEAWRDTTNDTTAEAGLVLRRARP